VLYFQTDPKRPPVMRVKTMGTRVLTHHGTIFGTIFIERGYAWPGGSYFLCKAGMEGKRIVSVGCCKLEFSTGSLSWLICILLVCSKQRMACLVSRTHMHYVQSDKSPLAGISNQKYGRVGFEQWRQKKKKVEK